MTMAEPGEIDIVASDPAGWPQLACQALGLREAELAQPHSVHGARARLLQSR